MEAALARKARKTTKRRVSDRVFKKEFTKIISDHLSVFPPEEQDRRIEAAGRVISKSRRASSSKGREAFDTQDRLAARTRG
jgi:hypothetical protein